MKSSNPNGRRVATVLLGVGVGVLLLANLGGPALWEPDEARHALIARGVAAAHDWRGLLLPRLHDRPYYDKPILFYWLAALAYRLIGTSAATARLVSVVAAGVTLLAVHRWARRTWGATTALWTVLVLATVGEFLALARFISLDMLLTCWVTLGILAGDRWLRAERPAIPWAVGLWAGFGMLTKGLVAPLLIGLVLGTTALAIGRWQRLRPRGLAGAALVMLAVAGPWYTAVGWLDPAYLRTFVLQHHFQRFFAAPANMHPKPFWFPSAMALVGFLPWTLLAPAVGARLWRERRWDDGTRLCLVWAATVVAFFSASSGKLGTYVLPAMVPLALLVGRGIGMAAQRADAAQPLRPEPLARGALILGAAVVLATIVVVPFVPRGAGFAPVARVVAPLGAALLAWGAWQGSIRHAGRAVFALGTLAGLAFFGVVAPRLAPIVTDGPLLATIASCESDGARLVASGVAPSGVAFAVGRRVPRVDQIRRIRHFATRPGGLLVVASPAQAEQLVGVGGLQPIASARHVLLSSGTCVAAGTGGPRTPRTMARRVAPTG